MAIEGQIIGFDEYMNFVLDGAQEIDTKTEKRTDVGRILLKGDAITLMQEAITKGNKEGEKQCCGCRKRSWTFIIALALFI